ncbi:MAG: hypothetical protein JWM32_409 [Verrucomicrobia bacterium]|nr:hypothetical protein [Verrucomicrobiota bacterium]
MSGGSTGFIFQKPEIGLSSVGVDAIAEIPYERRVKSARAYELFLPTTKPASAANGFTPRVRKRSHERRSAWIPGPQKKTGQTSRSKDQRGPSAATDSTRAQSRPSARDEQTLAWQQKAPRVRRHRALGPRCRFLPLRRPPPRRPPGQTIVVALPDAAAWLFQSLLGAMGVHPAQLTLVLDLATPRVKVAQPRTTASRSFSIPRRSIASLGRCYLVPGPNLLRAPGWFGRKTI